MGAGARENLVTEKGSRAVSSNNAILVVDDDDDLREALAATLSGHGYEVAEASNGEEALGYLQSHVAPRLIILDLMMPVMDGWTFCQRRNMDPALAAIPLLVVSASLNSHTPPAPAARFLRKPISLEELIAAVKDLC